MRAAGRQFAVLQLSTFHQPGVHRFWGLGWSFQRPVTEAVTDRPSGALQIPLCSAGISPQSPSVPWYHPSPRPAKQLLPWRSLQTPEKTEKCLFRGRSQHRTAEQTRAAQKRKQSSLELWSSGCSHETSSSWVSWELGNRNPGAQAKVLNQKFQGWSLAICVLTSPPH